LSSHRLTRRLTAIGATALAVVACAALPATAVTARGVRAQPAGEHVGTGAETADIVRNSYGVPSVYAKTTGGVWFGDGWAQAQDRLVQLELTRRAVEGTLSGIFGSPELGQDETARTFFYTSAEVRKQFQSMPAADRDALEAFSAGINAYENYAYADPASRVPYEFFVLGQALGQSAGTPYRPAAWTPEDTVAVGNYLAREFGGGGGSELQNLQFLDYLVAEQGAKGDVNAVSDATAIFNDARWLNDPTAPTTVPAAKAAATTVAATTGAATTGAGTTVGATTGTPATASTVATASTLASLHMLTPSAISTARSKLAADRNSILATGISLRVLSHGGSNAIAVAPWRSADHHALLWGAPQEGFGTPSVDWEVYLHGPRGYDAGGMAITGEPFVLIGRNADIAWTTTSEETVDQRIYVEQVNFADNPPRYLWDGKWIAMQAISEPIPVAGQSSPEPLTVYRTKDGPVFSADPSDGVAFSMRFASWGRETGSLEGFAQLGSDTNLSQFRHSMSVITTLHNFLYADKRGNIAYFGDGLVPIEPAFSKVDPRLPALGNGTQQWRGYVPFADMPHSVNPAQGYLDNWNTKPSTSAFYQQNEGDEYWGTIFRSSLISTMAASSRHITVGYLENIEHAIGTIDNQDNTRPAAPYFIPFVVRAYNRLRQEHNALTNPATHPDLAAAVSALQHWNGVTTLGSPAMSIFMNFLEAFEANVFEGGLNPGEQYTGRVNFSDSSLPGDLGTYGGLGGMGTYNLLYHILARTTGIDPCGTLCYQGGYFRGEEYQLLVESLNDAITILSGSGTQLGQQVPGFGTTDIAKWGFEPGRDQNWDSLDPLAVGITTTCGTSASQNRSTFMMGVDVGRHVVTGQDELPPGESAFISAAGVPSSHLCDQVGLFNTFRYKTMPRA
jgi:acyl-homoserine lactone acylase PvdQ